MLSDMYQISRFGLTFQMVENKVSAVTVKSRDGTVFSQLSASDLRNLGISNEIPLSLRSLMKTVEEFIEIVRASTNVIFRFSYLPDKTNYTLITASTTTIVSDVVYLLASSKVHRVWIKEGEEIVGVVSLTDVLKLLRECL